MTLRYCLLAAGSAQDAKEGHNAKNDDGVVAHKARRRIFRLSFIRGNCRSFTMQTSIWLLAIAGMVAGAPIQHVYPEGVPPRKWAGGFEIHIFQVGQGKCLALRSCLES
jgi:hypothetical protein